MIFRYTTARKAIRDSRRGFRGLSSEATADEQPIVIYKPPSQPSSGLSEIAGYGHELKQIYDDYISKIERAITGSSIQPTPEIITILKTSRLELDRNAIHTLAFLRGLDPAIKAEINSLVIGKDNVWGQNVQELTTQAWAPLTTGNTTDFAYVLLKQLPNLKEVALWMPNFEVDRYAIRAPEVLCNMLEAEQIDVVRFLLNGFDEDFKQHPILSQILDKEKVDLEEFEELYGDEPNFMRLFGAEQARIKALGPRFASSMEHPASWGRHVRSTNRQFPNHVVVTLRRVGENGICHFPTGDFDPNEEW